MDKHEDRLPCCEFCYYCMAPLPRRHEHDHFPIPKAAGGEQTVPACMNCHELKDRVPVEHWNATFAFEGLMSLLGELPTKLLSPSQIIDAVGDHELIWPQLPHSGRLLYAKARAAVEHRRAMDAANASLSPPVQPSPAD